MRGSVGTGGLSNGSFMEDIYTTITWLDQMKVPCSARNAKSKSKNSFLPSSLQNLYWLVIHYNREILIVHTDTVTKTHTKIVP